MSDWLNEVNGGEKVEDDEEQEPQTSDEETTEETQTVEEQETQDDSQGFEDDLREMVNTGKVNSINPLAVENRVDTVDDEDLLETAWQLASDENVRDAFGSRLNDLGVEVEEVESEEDSVADEEDEADIDEPEIVNDPTPEVETGMSDGGVAQAGEVDISQLAPDAISLDEAAATEHKWRIMVWADPGYGKTHFAYTMPEPVCIIDTEGKANDIAHKFDKEVFLFQPSGYDEVMSALDQSLNILDHYLENEDERGTLAIDSMSMMWEWAQQKYVDTFYPGKDPADVEFKSGLQGGQSDWKQIKKYHNEKFRKVMLDTPFHLCWTAMREDDYEAVFDNSSSGTPDKPGGEKNNVFKVDTILRVKEGDDGAPAGFLQKSGLTRHHYKNLRYPTFDKHRELIEAISDAELNAGDEEKIEIDLPYNVTLTEGRTYESEREDS